MRPGKTPPGGCECARPRQTRSSNCGRGNVFHGKNKQEQIRTTSTHLGRMTARGESVEVSFFVRSRCGRRATDRGHGVCSCRCADSLSEKHVYEAIAVGFCDLATRTHVTMFDDSTVVAVAR